MTVKRLLAAALTLCILLSALPLTAAAEGETEVLTLTEGEILHGFLEAGTECVSDDPSVAWVDASGDLRALKEGQTTITFGEESRAVTVTEYDDGSPVVGQLKILARFNDAMQFYDGHVYLLFTSYEDGVTITVDDLYAGYEISDLYYIDIRNDVSAGSNHTGSDAEKYFTLRDDMTSVTLDRGEIVTIGMYRDFNLSVPQAALGSILHSSLWDELSAAVKTEIVKAVFGLLEAPAGEEESAVRVLLNKLQENGLDYNLLLDGVVDGGVCFNRELYNQKLEWDQFENATYELDITENQLALLTAALKGNLNKFSILKNSCATVALRAWNAAVGTRDGADTAYKLDPTGEGLFALIDAPKTVKTEITSKLQGCYLNKSDSTPDELEPNAGFYDESGWVYVSAPEALPDLADDGTCVYPTVIGDAEAETGFYYKNGDEVVPLPCSECTELAPGTKLYVTAELSENDFDNVLSDITLDGVSILDSFDKAEGAYTAIMPEHSAGLIVSYQHARVDLREDETNFVQIAVGESLDVNALAQLQIGGKASDALVWELYDETDILHFADDGHKTLIADAPGSAFFMAAAAGNRNISVPVFIDVYESLENMVRVTFDDSTMNFDLVVLEEGEAVSNVPCSGYLVPKGTTVTVELMQDTPVVLSGFTVNGKNADYTDAFTLEEDTEFGLKFRAAEVTDLPEKIVLADREATYRLEPSVRYADAAAALLPVYDGSVSYEVSDPVIAVDENGVLAVAGEIPAEGKCVYVTVIAGSSNGKVFQTVKVILGDYAGERIVGRFTISSRSVTPGEIVSHTAITFTTYEDIDLNVSYYEYYQPNEKFYALMDDYKQNPDKYPGDPALYSEAIDLGDRESYFTTHTAGTESEPRPVHLDAEEGITVSHYSFDSNTDNILLALEEGQLSSSEAVKTLLEQFRAYQSGEGFDGAAAFDSLLAVLQQMYLYKTYTGYNPADGRSTGGQMINREAYNQFRSTNSQFPNLFYTVELTADELAVLQAALADPTTNYFAVFTNNCGSAGVDLWNAVLADRPELHLTGSLTGLFVEPQSIYFELAQLTVKTGKLFEGAGEGGGKDFYPRIYPGHLRETPDDRQLPFTDVAESDYFYDAVRWAYFAEPQVTNGVTETLFAPGQTCTRAQVVTFLWRAMGCPEPGDVACPFTDADKNAYYYKAMLWAVENGVTDGTSKTTFSPNDPCTRGQIVTFLWRTEGKPAAEGTSPFTDVSMNAYYTDAVLWAVENGVTNGTSDTTFSPNDPCTRGQIVTFLYRDMGK